MICVVETRSASATRRLSRLVTISRARCIRGLQVGTLAGQDGRAQHDDPDVHELHHLFRPHERLQEHVPPYHIGAVDTHREEHEETDHPLQEANEPDFQGRLGWHGHLTDGDSMEGGLSQGNSVRQSGASPRPLPCASRANTGGAAPPCRFSHTSSRAATPFPAMPQAEVI